MWGGDDLNWGLKPLQLFMFNSMFQKAVFMAFVIPSGQGAATRRSPSVGGLTVVTGHHSCFPCPFVPLRRWCVCVCVCPPLDKGFSTTTPYRQGRVALSPYHTQRSYGREWEAGPDQPCVPAVLSSCDSTLHVFDSWFFTFPPPNLFLPQTCSRV